MNKFIIHGFLGALVIGLFIAQINHEGSKSLMSNALTSRQKERDICTKPEKFSAPDESAWCSQGFVKNIEENQHTWHWSCLAQEIEYSCHFTENISYSHNVPRILKKT